MSEGEQKFGLLLFVIVTALWVGIVIYKYLQFVEVIKIQTKLIWHLDMVNDHQNRLIHELILDRKEVDIRKWH